MLSMNKEYVIHEIKNKQYTNIVIVVVIPTTTVVIFVDINVVVINFVTLPSNKFSKAKYSIQ